MQSAVSCSSTPVTTSSSLGAGGTIENTQTDEEGILAPTFPHKDCLAAQLFDDYAARVRTLTRHRAAMTRAFEALARQADRDPEGEYADAHASYQQTLKSFVKSVASYLQDMNAIHQTHLPRTPVPIEDRVFGLFPGRYASATQPDVDFENMVGEWISKSSHTGEHASDECELCDQLVLDTYSEPERFTSCCSALRNFTTASLNNDVAMTDDLAGEYKDVSPTKLADVHGMLKSSHSALYWKVESEWRTERIGRVGRPDVDSGPAGLAFGAMEHATKSAEDLDNLVKMAVADNSSQSRVPRYAWPVKLLQLCTSENATDRVPSIELPYEIPLLDDNVNDG